MYLYFQNLHLNKDNLFQLYQLLILFDAQMLLVLLYIV